MEHLAVFFDFFFYFNYIFLEAAAFLSGFLLPGSVQVALIFFFFYFLWLACFSVELFYFALIFGSFLL